MTAPEPVKPLSEDEEQSWRDMVAVGVERVVHASGVRRLFATLDVARDERDAERNSHQKTSAERDRFKMDFGDSWAVVNEADELLHTTATIPAIRELIRELAAERKRREAAEAVIAKLPRTADGVPIVPGMTVWIVADPMEPGTVRLVTTTRAEVERSRSIVWSEGNGLFSTQEAATASHAAWLAAKEPK